MGVRKATKSGSEWIGSNQTLSVQPHSLSFVIWLVTGVD